MILSNDELISFAKKNSIDKLSYLLYDNSFERKLKLIQQIAEKYEATTIEKKDLPNMLKSLFFYNDYMKFYDYLNKAKDITDQLTQINLLYLIDQIIENQNLSNEYFLNNLEINNFVLRIGKNNFELNQIDSLSIPFLGISAIFSNVKKYRGYFNLL